MVDFEFEFLFEYVLASDIESVFEPLADFEFEFAFEYFLVFDIESVFGPVLVSVFELAFVLGHVRVKEFKQKYRFLTPYMTTEITVILLINIISP